MKTYVDIQFKGAGFSPKRLRELTKLPIESLVESGELGKIGRYKGKPTPYGIGLLKVDALDNNLLTKYSKTLLKEKDALKESKVEEIIFDVEASPKDLASFSISPELAKLIASLNARLEFNQVEEKEDFYFLINILSSSISLSNSIPQKRRINKLLQVINNNHLTHTKHVTAKYSYALVMYLLKNLHKRNEDEIESFDSNLKEFNKDH
jgi:hypothetical protein